jgi:hypothetical protein
MGLYSTYRTFVVLYVSHRYFYVRSWVTKTFFGKGVVVVQ